MVVRGENNPIEITGLTKRFGRATAVSGLDLTVHPGTVHGFLGPNGAGKTTTIRALLGLLKADAGRVRLNGIDPARDPARATARTAYVPGDVALWPQMRGADALATLARLRSAGDDPALRRELIARFELDPSKRIRDYSKGNRQKVALIAAFAAHADVLVLDEPTSGLDPLMERVFTDCLREAVANGKSVLLSSHILSEVQELAQDITIIRAGKVVESGPLAQLSHLRGSQITALLPDGSEYSSVVPAEKVGQELNALITRKATHITCTPTSLEDIFLGHYTLGGRTVKTLLAISLKTHRVFLAAWLLPLIVLAFAMGPLQESAYPDPAELARTVVTIRDNAGVIAMYGTVPEPYTLGGYITWQMGMLIAVSGSVLALLLTTSLTRGYEDTTLMELIRACGIPTRTPALSAAIISLGICLVLGGGVGLVLLGAGTFVADIPARGSALFGAAIAAQTACFAAFGLFAAQLLGSRRGALSLGFALLGASYMLRAVADANGIAWLNWVSPLGWREVISPYREDRAWPLLPMLLVVATVTGLAVALAGKRDLGRGWLRTRFSGPQDGRVSAPGRGRPLFAVHLWQARGTILGWAVAIAGLSLMWGFFTGDIAAVINASPETAAMFKQLGGDANPLVTYLLLVGNLIGALLCAFAVQTALLLRRNEKVGLLALETTGGVSRGRSYTSVLLVTGAGTLALAGAAAAGLSLGAFLSMPEDSLADALEICLWAAAGAAPPALFLAGVTALLLALSARLYHLVWLPFGWSIFLAMFGASLRLDASLRDTSLVAHGIYQADGSLTWGGALWLLAGALACAALGVALAERRDLAQR